MPNTPPDKIAFETTVAGSGGKTGIVIPADVLERLGAGRRPAVHVEVNGYAYRSTVAVMAGQYHVGVSAAVREATGLAAGDQVKVALAVATAPREVDMPQELEEALATDDRSRAFFETLSNSMQRYHADNINAAKTADTRQRRVQKALALFRDGKKR